MGIITTVKELFFDVYKAETIQQKGMTGQYAVMANGSIIPIDSAGNYTILNSNNEAYSKLPIVYKIASTIAQRCAEAEIEQYERIKDGKEIETSEFLDLLAEPNPYQSQTAFITELSLYLTLHGEFYIYVPKAISRTTYKTGINLYSLPPLQVTKHVGNRFSWNGFLIPEDEIYYYRDFTPNLFVELNTSVCSPLGVAEASINSVDYSNAANLKVLKNGGVPGVAYEKPIVGTMPLDGSALKDLQDKLQKRYNNSYTYGEVPLYGNEIGYTSFGLNPRDLMILENIEFNEKRIAYAFKYPLLLLSDKGGSLGSNERKEANKELLLNAVFPKLEIITGILTKILNDKKYKITYDKYSFAEMEDDWETLSKSLANMPFLSWNEKRKVLKFDPLADPIYDEPFIPTGLMTAEEFTAQGQNQEVLPVPLQGM
jgi:HK97 family phage portal protein